MSHREALTCNLVGTIYELQSLLAKTLFSYLICIDCLTFVTVLEIILFKCALLFKFHKHTTYYHAHFKFVEAVQMFRE